MRKIFTCTPKTAVEEGNGVRATHLTNLATYAFRRPASPTDVDLLMEFYRSGAGEGLDQGIEMALARVLASPQFIYRIEEEPAAALRPGLSHQRKRPGLAPVVLPVESAPDAGELLRVATQRA